MKSNRLGRTTDSEAFVSLSTSLMRSRTSSDKSSRARAASRRARQPAPSFFARSVAFSRTRQSEWSISFSRRLMVVISALATSPLMAKGSPSSTRTYLRHDRAIRMRRPASSKPATRPCPRCRNAQRSFVASYSNAPSEQVTSMRSLRIIFRVQ